MFLGNFDVFEDFTLVENYWNILKCSEVLENS